MGKKRKKTVKKTKELSVVGMADSSSSSIIGQEIQQQTPRKRGRPRKITQKAEILVVEEDVETKHEAEAKQSLSKEEEEEEEETSSAKELEGISVPRSRRARRKITKPRKSSS